MTDYATRIHLHLEQYHCNHYGKLPKVIFISARLYSMLAANPENITFYNTADGIVAMFHHIPLRVYSSDKLEYYFVESGGEFN